MTIPQAHVRNPVAHADISKYVAGTVIGIALGAVIVVAIVGSAGTLTVVGVVGYASTGVSVGGSIGAYVGEIIVDPAENSAIEGYIVDGSPDTFVGEAREKAARASPHDPKTLVDCHGGDYVIQGSETVFINRCSASRRKDGTSCGGLIDEGDPTVFTGGAPATLYEWGGVPYDANLRKRDTGNLALSLIGLLAAPTTTLGKYLYAGNLVGTGMQASDVWENTAPSTASQLLGQGLMAGGTLDAVTDPGNAGVIKGIGGVLRKIGF